MADTVTIIIVTGQHSYSGALKNNGLCVSDLLNDPNTEFLQLLQIAWHRKFFEQNVENLPEAIVSKASIDFVLLKQGKHEAPCGGTTRWLRNDRTPHSWWWGIMKFGAH